MNHRALVTVIFFQIFTIIFALDSHAIPTLDPRIPTISPHRAPSSDSCVGQCAFIFVDEISNALGPEKSVGLLNLNYNDFLTSFSNTTFVSQFCKLYHGFQYCYSRCSHGYLQELLHRSAEVMDHFCVYNYQAIQEKFPCLANIDKEVSQQCLKTCTPHHTAVTSMMQHFKHLALNGDSTQAEKHLNETCEYVTCSLHCDVPTIAHICGFDTADLVINLTRRSFASLESMALDTGAVSKWPALCSDIKTYALPRQAKSGAQPPVLENLQDLVIAQGPTASIARTTVASIITSTVSTGESEKLLKTSSSGSIDGPKTSALLLSVLMILISGIF